jgi:hypothetical protein
VPPGRVPNRLAAAKLLGIETVPILAANIGFITSTMPRRAHRIFERLRDEKGFTGGYS